MKALASFAATATLLGACSSQHASHPPELGDCVPPPDAACASPTLPSGSTAGGPDSALQTNDASVTATGCGSADLLVITTNGYCKPCITSTVCCQADQRCDPTCQALLQCIQKCTPGDQLCVGPCQTDPLLQAGVTAYLDFAACLAQNCPACPTLQHQ